MGYGHARRGFPIVWTCGHEGLVHVASGRVASILFELADPSAGDESLPQRLVRACAREVPVSGVGLVLMSDSGLAGVAAATDGLARLMEELQFTVGEGPGVESCHSGRPVLEPDLTSAGSRRWPAFASGALQAGVCAMFALPLRVGSIRLGVLDLYRDVPGGLSPAHLAEALSFADAATAVLLHLQSVARPDRDDVAGIGMHLVEDRAQVHQATGFIAERVDVSMSDALMLLRARAYASDRLVTDLARDVLSGVVQFTRDEDREDGS